MSIWTRFISRFQESFDFIKKPARVCPKPQLTQLEDRVVPAGKIYAILFDGFGGQGLTNTSTNQIIYDSLVKSDEATDIEYNDKENWNGEDNFSNPGGLDARLNINTQNILGLDVPTGVSINPIVLPDPINSNDQVDYYINYLNYQTDDNDFIVLVGHSMGAYTATKIANGTFRQIDMLIAIDPVGYSPESQTFGIHNKILPSILGVTGEVRIDLDLFRNSDPDFLPMKTNEGYIGSRQNLEGPNKGNVKYYINRWQKGYDFPLDYQRSGQIANVITTNKLEDYVSLNGSPLPSQRDASEMRNADGSPRNRSATTLDWLYGHTHPTVKYDGLFGTPSKITLDKVNLNTHSINDSIVIDDLVQAEIKAALDAFTPMAPIVSAGPDFSGVLEGSSITVTQATASDPNPDDKLTYSWYCSSYPANVNFSDIKITGSNTLNPTFVFPDNGSYEFTLYVTDGFGSTSSTLNFSVDNVAPSVSVPSISNDIVSQFVLDLNVLITDPGIYDSPVAYVDYGDGSLPNHGLSASGPFRHTYLNPGIYTINITATDKDGGVGTATQQVTVKSFGIVPNPNGGGDMLAVGGTPGIDEVHLNTLDGETFSGTVNGEVIRPIVVPSHAASIRTGAGNDFVALGLGQGKGAIPTKVNVDMGSGNDKFASFSQTAGASARNHGNGFYQYSYFGVGNAYVAVVGNETPIIEPNVDDSYIAALYHKLLERNPSKAEVKVWSKQFATETYEYIAHNIFYSVERSAKTVNNWYQTYLGRAASKTEAQPWVNLIVAGKNEEETLAKFLGSREYIARQGSGTAFINSLYNQFLGRNASQAAINSWFRDYGNPPNYYEVAKAILTSKEYQAREITSYYDRFLDRHQASVSGFANNNAFARRGVGPREVSDWIFANVSPHAARYQMLWSPEFRVNGL